MIAAPDGDLHVYMLNVGQADTTIIVSPQGHVIIMDATKPAKVKNLLTQLNNDGNIEHLIVTHPHSDHFGGCNSLAQALKISKATLPPFWHAFGMGPPTYRQIVGRLETQGTDINFLSGYSRWYPDDIMTAPADGSDPVADPDKPFLEFLGPTNEMIRCIEDSKTFEANHLSIMCRITWKSFRMIIAGDAQMENWAAFDRERLLENKCQVLRAAHHGSKNGTQWERIERLGPSAVIISSDPQSKDELPDLCGSAIFAKFDGPESRFATMTKDTGTIHLSVSSSGKWALGMLGDSVDNNVNLQNSTPLAESSNPTNWISLLQERMTNL